MKGHPFFSIIIPVFNVHDYLPQAMDSVASQDFWDYEIILVNDGSTDGSGELCDAYAHASPGKVLVLHKVNGGPAAARNVALDIATGDYVVFLDSDDWLEPHALSTIHGFLAEIPMDVFGFTYYRIVNGGQVFQTQTVPARKNVLLGMDEFLSEGFPDPDVWDKVFRREFLDANNIRFPEGFLHEDIEFTIRVCCFAERLMFLDRALYNYRPREGSIMTSRDPEHLCERLDCLCRIVEHLKALRQDYACASKHFVAIEKRVAEINYGIFCTLLFSEIPYSMALAFYTLTRSRGAYPLKTGNSFFRWLSHLSVPFFVFRLVARFVRVTHPLRRMIQER